MDAANVLHDPHNSQRGYVYLDHSMDKNNDNLLLSSSFSSIVTKDHGQKNVHEAVEIDYRGHEVNIQKFRDVLLNKDEKVKFSNNSRILLYMTGHGGQEFLKFHDYEELTAQHFSSIIRQMADNKLFSKMLIVLDTCQAATLLEKYINEISNVIFVSSSMLNQNSYGYFTHPDLGIVTYDRFTYALYQFFQRNYFPWRKQFYEFSTKQHKNISALSISKDTKKEFKKDIPRKIRDLTISEVMLSFPQEFLYSTVSIQEQARQSRTFSILYFFSSAEFQSFVSYYNGNTGPLAIELPIHHPQQLTTDADKSLQIILVLNSTMNPSYHFHFNSSSISFEEQFVNRKWTTLVPKQALSHLKQSITEPLIICAIILISIFILSR
jgi:glycosylphosphatidylinositol transamidase (GPIT) subunit GPI8